MSLWRRSQPGHGASARDLEAYRATLEPRMTRIEEMLITAAAEVEALRYRQREPDEVGRAMLDAESELDETAEALRGVDIPEPLQSLHMEYEANLERAMRGIVTVQAGCSLTRLRHRPRDDDEPQLYWKRGQLNIIHSQMRMAEIRTVLLAWRPGRPADASVAGRLHSIEG